MSEATAATIIEAMTGDEIAREIQAAYERGEGLAAIEIEPSPSGTHRKVRFQTTPTEPGRYAVQCAKPGGMIITGLFVTEDITRRGERLVVIGTTTNDVAAVNAAAAAITAMVQALVAADKRSEVTTQDARERYYYAAITDREGNTKTSFIRIELPGATQNRKGSTPTWAKLVVSSDGITKGFIYAIGKNVFFDTVTCLWDAVRYATTMGAPSVWRTQSIRAATLIGSMIATMDDVIAGARRIILADAAVRTTMAPYVTDEGSTRIAFGLDDNRTVVYDVAEVPNGGDARLVNRTDTTAHGDPQVFIDRQGTQRRLVSNGGGTDGSSNATTIVIERDGATLLAATN